MKTSHIPTGRNYRVLHTPDNVGRVIYEGDSLTAAVNTFERQVGHGIFQLWVSNTDGTFGDRYFESEDHLVFERHGPLVVSIDNHEFCTLIFQRRTCMTMYLWGDGHTSEVRPGPGRICDVNTDWGSGKWFLFWIEDCFCPPMFIVQHDSFEDAYEEFVDWQADQLKIDDSDLKDYLEDKDDESKGYNCSYTSNGVPIDTESVKGEQVFLIAAFNFPSAGKQAWNIAATILGGMTLEGASLPKGIEEHSDVGKAARILSLNAIA